MKNLATLDDNARAALDEMVPRHLQGGLVRYIEVGIPPGHFLTAVLSNDLIDACGRADATSAVALTDIVKWLYNHAPGNCWRSREAVEAWCERGLVALHAEAAE